MLAVPADRLPAAIGDLDPGNRALLDLSLRRGVSDAEIGELLRKEPDDVARGREAVLELLADALDMGGHDRRERVRQAVAALPDEAWSPCRPATATAAARDGGACASRGLRRRRPRRRMSATRMRDATPRPPASSTTTSTSRPEDERRPRRLGLLWVLGLMAVLGVVAAIVLSSGDDDSTDDGNRSQPTPSQDGPGAEPGGCDGAARAARRRPGRGGPVGHGRGRDHRRSAACRSRRAATRSGCTTASSRRSRSGRSRAAAAGSRSSCPPTRAATGSSTSRRSRADGNPNHSGDSVLRASLRELLSD